MKKLLSLSLIAALALAPAAAFAGTVVVNQAAGYSIGTGATQKVGFYGATPAVQPTTANQTALTDSTTGSTANATLAAVTAATALTDSTTGTAGTTLAAGVGIQTLTIPLTSLATGLSTAAIDLLTNYTPGYRFKVLSFDFVTTVAGTGSSASQTFNLEIDTTNVTGGVLNPTLSSTDTIGKVTSGTAVSAANVGTAAQTLSIEMAASGTVFTAGAGYFVIKLQNMDTADAIASLAARQAENRLAEVALTDAAAKTAKLVNAIRSGLVTLGIIKGS